MRDELVSDLLLLRQVRVQVSQGRLGGRQMVFPPYRALLRGDPTSRTRSRSRQGQRNQAGQIAL